jgi:hypothetical protein
MYIDRMKRTEHHLTDLQIKKLKKLSKESGISVAELIRRAIDEFLKNK